MIIVHGRPFRISIPAPEIALRVAGLASEMDLHYANAQGLPLVVLPVMNGALLFAADLLRALQTPTEVHAIKVASYHGTESSGQVQNVFGVEGRQLAGRHVVLVEDIVDTGTTLHHLLPLLRAHQPASLKVATLLHKPDAAKFEVPTDFVGFEVPSVFFLGYGLDYDGHGRGLSDLYTLDEGSEG